MFPEQIRSNFPIFDKNPNLVYLDSASTTMVPKVAVEAVYDFLCTTVSSSRRGAHSLAVRGSTIVEDTRKKVASFVDTKPAQISFQKSIPSAVTSFALGYDWTNNKRDTILIAESEEHSTIVPLQRVGELLDLRIVSIQIDDQGILELNSLEHKLDKRVGIVAIGSTTMGWGIRNPLSEIASLVHDTGALLLSDTSRSFAFDEKKILQAGVDIAIFSGNTSFMSPPGITIQWINEDLGADHIPGIVGGSSVANVDMDTSEIALQPDKFEPGIINVPAIAGLGCAIDFLEKIGETAMRSHLEELASHTLKRLKDITREFASGR
jgi:selenocysteine lyase/cysteine desulfurase